MEGGNWICLIALSTASVHPEAHDEFLVMLGMCFGTALWADSDNLLVAIPSTHLWLVHQEEPYPECLFEDSDCIGVARKNEP